MMDAILTATHLGFPVDLLLKATLVMAVAGAAAAGMGRASAATRHMVWGIAVGALLLLPFLALLGPRWEVPVERGWTTAAGSATGGSASAAPFSGGPIGASASGTGVGDAGESAAVGNAGVGDDPRGQEPLIGSSGRVEWVDLGLAIWAAGLLLLLVRIGLGWWGTRRLSRSADPVTDADWLQLLKDAAWLQDVDREVALLRSPLATTPMTWGTRKPMILIPAAADDWPEERRRVVLLHEMAHVARRDCLTQTIAEIACALYWFHPLVWVASRHLRVERERACDDRVLAAGEGAADYAGHLLEVARASRGQMLYSAAAIGMARPSQLEGRLLAVLDGARRRGGPGQRQVLVACGVVALAIIPLAAVRAVDAQERETADEQPTLLQQIRATIGETATGLREKSGIAGLAEGFADDPATAADSVVDLSIAARSGGSVEIEINDGGELTIVGWQNDYVELHAELRGRSASEMRVELTGRNGTVALFAEHTGPRGNRGGSHTFELRVPVSSNLHIENGGGGVSIENVSGSFTGGTGGGEIILERLAGHAELSTGGGTIRVSDSRLDGTVSTGGGNVLVRNNVGDLRGSTGGGNVLIENSGTTSTGSAGAPTRLHTGGGHISLTDLPSGADLSTGGGDIAVRSVGGPLVARTGGGDILIERATSSVDVSTGAGDIVIGAAAGSAIGHTGSGDIEVALTSANADRDVDLRSGSGDISLTVPADFQGSFEIVVEGRSPESNQIRSDFPLATETSRGNTLRATGSTGSGASRVTVRTSSGDVTIRRAGSSGAAARTYPGPAGRSVNDATGDFERTIDRAFSDAFGPEFENRIEELVTTGVSSFTVGLAEFTVEVTASALEQAVQALERAEREGRLTMSERRDLVDLKEELAEMRSSHE